ncbi:MAG: PKD domain-containing protein [Candidatus Hodarchaeales archaeon]
MRKSTIFGLILLIPLCLVFIDIRISAAGEITHDITLDATDISIKVGIEGYDFVDIGGSRIFNLVEGDYVIGTYRNGRLINTHFQILSDGTIAYDTSYDGITLEGLGTSVIKVLGYPVTIDMSDIDINIRLFDLDWLSGGEIATYRLPPKASWGYFFETGFYGRIPLANFQVELDGTVLYDVEYDGVTLEGLATSVLKVLGYPITVDASNVSTTLQLHGIYEYIPAGSSKTLWLPPETDYMYRVVSHPGGGLPDTAFAVTTEGTVLYDPEYDRVTLEGLGTSSLKVLGYPITVDGSDVSPAINLYGFAGYIPTGGTRTYHLPPKTGYGYRIVASSSYILYDTPFQVTTEGTVDYDLAYDGVTLAGKGTSTITLVGHPITIDTSGFALKTGVWGIDWIPKGGVKTYRLPAGRSFYNYSLLKSGNFPTNLQCSDFFVDLNGSVVYDPSYDGITLEGMGTSYLKVLGYPVTIDLSNVSSNLRLWGMDYSDIIEAGTSRTYSLMPNNKYGCFTSSPGGNLLEYFQVFANGTCFPSEITFEYGTIKIYCVLNEPPTAFLWYNTTIEHFEGVPVHFDGRESNDPDNDSLEFRWDYTSDGIWDTEWSDDPSTSYIWNDDWSGSISLEVSDGELTDIDTKDLIVKNMAPEIHEITAPYDPIRVETSVSVYATFSDLGALDSHTAIWDWGDGITSEGIIVESLGCYGSVIGSHIYATPGVYTINLTLCDDDNGIVSDIFQYIVVYDPEGGFVTGGGWFNSPVNAYLNDPTLTGKANFGFVSKYKNGANLPTGKTTFHFRAANFKFQSSNYDWLVIAGLKVMYKGTGTINGQGEYKFVLTATDGQKNGGGGYDRIRIRIWDIITGNVIYDNQRNDVEDADATTIIQTGSIVIHKM